MALKYFTDNEFKCKCGCGMDISDNLKEKLDKARGIAGVPFRINSGARCKSHNASINASPTSSHTLGLAVDLGFTNSTETYKIIDALIKTGFERIGINFAKNFVHCDIDNAKVKPCIFKY